MLYVTSKSELDESLLVTGASEGDYLCVFAQRDNNTPIVFGGTITGLTEQHAGAGLGTAVGYKQLTAADADGTKTVTIDAGTGRRLSYCVFRLDSGETLDSVEMQSAREASTDTPTTTLVTGWSSGDALFVGFGRQTSNTTLTTPDANITGIREATGTGHRSHYVGYTVAATDPSPVDPLYAAASAYYRGSVHFILTGGGGGGGGGGGRGAAAPGQVLQTGG